MAIIRNRTKQQYTNVAGSILRNPELSLRDRGLLITLLSLPEDWEFSVAGLQQILKLDGKHSIMESLKHLEQLGYLIRKQSKSENGKFSHGEWDVFEEPCKASPLSDFPQTVKPPSEKPSSGNQPQSIINISIIKESNMNQSKDDRENAYQEYKDKWEYDIVAKKVSAKVLDAVCAELMEREEKDRASKKDLLEICRNIEEYNKPISSLSAFVKSSLDNYFSRKIYVYQSKKNSFHNFMQREYDFEELEKVLLSN